MFDGFGDPGKECKRARMSSLSLEGLLKRLYSQDDGNDF